MQAGVRLLQGVADAFEQVRLAQPDGAVDHQRVEGRAGRLGHLSRRGVRQAVARPRHEILEPPRRPARRSDRGLAIGHKTWPASASAGGARSVFGRGFGPGGDEGPGPPGDGEGNDRGALGLPGIGIVMPPGAGVRIGLGAGRPWLDHVAQRRLRLVADLDR